MPLKNIRQEFFPLTDTVVGSSAPLSHLEERAHIITAKGSANKVQEALASHRHWGYRGVVYKNNKNEINPGKEADTFKRLKKKFSEAQHNDDGSPEEEMGPSL